MKSLIASAVLFTVFSSSFAFAAGEQENFKCFGTEPFWDVTVQNDKVIYGSVGGDKMQFPITQRSHPLGTAPSFGTVIKAGAKGEVTATIRSDERCNDGMSDAQYSHEIWFLYKDTLVVGCCRNQ